jgi:hypothetical protein
MTPTITSREQMLQAVGQLGRLYEALGALRREVEPLNPRNFAILAEGHLDDIRRLRDELDRYAGVVAARETAVPLWVRVVGPGIEGDCAPTSVLTSILDALRKGVATVAEFVLTGGLTTRPTAALKTASDFRIVALAPGSLRVGVRLPEGEGDENRAAYEALGDYLNVASWAGSGQPTEALEVLLPDSRRRTVVLTEVARLVPREKGQVETVELSGALLPADKAPVVLARPSRERINGAIDRAAAERVETHVGDLREIDLDESSFVLRNAEDGTPQVRCYFPAEMVEAAKEALDKRIRVTGSRPVKEGRQAPPLMVSRLEIVDERW